MAPKNYVFIQTGPEQFEMREITTGRTLGKRLEVTGGIKQGEPVAVKGAFILKFRAEKRRARRRTWPWQVMSI